MPIWHRRRRRLTMSAMKDIRLLGILFLALAVRTAMLFSVSADIERAKTPDSQEYENLAAGWLQTGEYEDPLPIKRIYFSGCLPRVYRAEIFRTPGYPALLAGAVRATPKNQSAQSPLLLLWFSARPSQTTYQIILSFQVLVDLHLVMLTFFLGRSLAGHGAGLLAALFQAVSPLAAAASCRILTDGIFAFMLTAAVLLLLRHFRTGGWWLLLSAGLVMGAACYVRPVGLAFSAVMALVILFSRRSTGRSTGILPVSSMGILPVSRRSV